MGSTAQFNAVLSTNRPARVSKPWSVSALTFLLAATGLRSILTVVRGAVDVMAERGAAVPDPWNLIRIMPAKG
jgi:hypothetical protein